MVTVFSIFFCIMQTYIIGTDNQWNQKKYLPGVPRTYNKSYKDISITKIYDSGKKLG